MFVIVLPYLNGLLLNIRIAIPVKLTVDGGTETGEEVAIQIALG